MILIALWEIYWCLLKGSRVEKAPRINVCYRLIDKKLLRLIDKSIQAS